MATRSEALGGFRPDWRRQLALPATLLGTAALALGSGAGAAVVATQFHDKTAVVVLVALVVAPLLAVAIIINPLVAVLVVLATFPIGSVAQDVGPLRIQAVEVAVFVAATVVVLRRLAVGKIPLPFAGPLGWAIALFLWTLISMFSAIDETLAVKVLFSLLGGIVCSTVVLAGCRDMRDLRVLLGGFVASGSAIALITLSETGHVSFTSEFGGSEIVSGRLQGAFDSPNQLGSLFALMVPIAASLVFGLRALRWRIVSAGALLLLLAALMLSLSRGAWIGAGVAAIFMLIKLREARRLLVLVSIPVAILGFFIWSLAPSNTEVKVVGERAKAINALSPYDHRQVIYKEAFREIKEKPLLGVGPGGFQVASTRVVSESSTLSYAHAHNLYLNWAAETGIPSLIIIFGFAIGLGLAGRTASRGAMARGDPADRALVIGISAALLSVLGQGAVDYVIPNPVVYIAMWTLVGALLVTRREAQETLSATPR
jgi:O-antigen ligase